MSKEFKIKQKVEKDFSSFSDVVNNMGKEELEKELFRLANYKEEVQLAKGEDEGLKNAQEVGFERAYSLKVKPTGGEPTSES